MKKKAARTHSEVLSNAHRDLEHEASLCNAAIKPLNLQLFEIESSWSKQRKTVEQVTKHSLLNEERKRLKKEREKIISLLCEIREEEQQHRRDKEYWRKQYALSLRKDDLPAGMQRLGNPKAI